MEPHRGASSHVVWAIATEKVEQLPEELEPLLTKAPEPNT